MRHAVPSGERQGGLFSWGFKEFWLTPCGPAPRRGVVVGVAGWGLFVPGPNGPGRGAAPAPRGAGREAAGTRLLGAGLGSLPPAPKGLQGTCRTCRRLGPGERGPILQPLSPPAPPGGSHRPQRPPRRQPGPAGACSSSPLAASPRDPNRFANYYNCHQVFGAAPRRRLERGSSSGCCPRAPVAVPMCLLRGRSVRSRPRGAFCLLTATQTAPCTLEQAK